MVLSVEFSQIAYKQELFNMKDKSKNIDQVRPSVEGKVEIRVFKKGKLKKTIKGNNLILSAARESMANIVTGLNTGDKLISAGAVGSNATAPSPGDTALTDEVVCASVLSVTTNGTGQVLIKFVVAESEANGMPGGTVAEFGLRSDDATLFARRVVSPLTKNSTIRFEVDWRIQF